MDSKRNNLPELLSPCGSYESLEAAIKGGADAVYFGGTLLNARMNAKNFSRSEIISAISDCHAEGVKAYVTMNTQVYDREMKNALEYAAFLKSAGADALIVADFGLSQLIKKYIPHMELHASTQMTVHNPSGANFLFDHGFSRVVGARELSKDNIKALCKSSKAEVELFVHGAICVSCSGQCLMSSMLGGRSGNRGECAQPCRMSYNGTFPISMKDMCLASHITELISCNISSLKIEGRMKSPSYVFGVTKIYRKLLDEKRNATNEDISELAKLFSRGGFTDGYYTKRIDASMLGTRSSHDIQSTHNSPSFHGSNTSHKSSELSLTDKISVPEKLDFPIKKAMRKPIITARFQSASQIPENHRLDHIYLPLSKYQSVADGVILPPIIFESELDSVKRNLDAAVKKGAKHVMLCNIGQLDFAEQFGLIPHGDFRFNTFNTFTANALTNAVNLESLILSCELTLPQIRDICFSEDTLKGAVTYGRYPLMLLEKAVGKERLRDTRGAIFPVLSEGNRDIVYNSVPVYMADQADRLDKAGIEERHMIFSNESRAEVMRILYAYSNGIIPKENIRRLK